MGPPEDVLTVLPPDDEEIGLLVKGEVGVLGEYCSEDGGSVSHERVRRHDCRIMLKDEGATGSCVEV